LYPAAIPRIFLHQLEELEYDIMHPEWTNQVLPPHDLNPKS
jgi:hypothetical protein